uniref:NADH-ubiquinone oxidoreductase chain 6 n=1 Tax=Cnemoplites australis TaxID=2547837 RepID=A0A6H0N5X0_9CUCU|nr:NADH dehydrogenase subunit 6 [Cnemoplites australis]
MTMNILITTMLMLTIIFLFMNHPLSFGLILLLQTLSITLITGMMNYTFWFSYILFLIMVGGMLILFIYMTSVASNEKFKFSPKIFLLTLTMMIMSTPLLVSDSTLTNMSNFCYELSKQGAPYENALSLSKFMNTPMNSNLMLIIMYLLITLIVVVKLTNIQHGPLRQKF